MAKQMDFCHEAANSVAAWPWSFVGALLCLYLISISGLALNLEGDLASTFTFCRWHGHGPLEG